MYTISCIFSAWTPFPTIHFGNCFTFNMQTYGHEVTNKDTFTTSISGQNFGILIFEKNIKNIYLHFHLRGLTLILDLEQSNYMYNGLTKGAGVRIAVHDPETW